MPRFVHVGVVAAFSLVLAAPSVTPQNAIKPRAFPKFFLVASKSEGDGFPTGPAKLCLSAASSICYETPSDTEHELYYGAHPVAKVLETPEEQWVMFSSECGGGSGWGIKVAILRYRSGEKNAFRNLLPEIELPNLGEWVTWHIPSTSRYPVFVTAEYIWEGMEAHYGLHRYKIKAYRYNSGARLYRPVLSYQTKRHYPSDDVARVRVLELEKKQTLARLARLDVTQLP